MGLLVREVSFFGWRAGKFDNDSSMNNGIQRQTFSANSEHQREFIKKRLNTVKTALEEDEFYQVAAKRETIVHPSTNSFSKVSKGANHHPSPNLLVTKPNKVYKISELVPPSFFLGLEESPGNFFNTPKTYQSYLAAKYNMIPSKYLPRPQVQYLQRSEMKGQREENNFQYKTVTEGSVDGDWKIHWIEKR